MTAPKGGGKKNAAKTHCPKGHPYDFTNKRGQRCCRTCAREAAERFRKKHRYVG